MNKMLISVEMDEESVLAAIGRIDTLAFKLQREVREIQNAIKAKEEADSENEPTKGD